MAKFCGNCGMQLEDDARVCGKCGTPYESNEVPSSGMSPQTKKKIKKIAILSAIGVVVIIIGIISINIFSYMTGYERTIDTYFQAINEYNVDKALCVVSEAGMSLNTSVDYDKTFSNMISNMLDSYESQVGHDPKVSYEIVDSYKLSDRKYQNFLTMLEDNYKYDTGDINEIVCVNVKPIITGSRSSKTLSVEEMYILKEKGKWLIYTGSTNGITSSSSSNSLLKY